MYLLMKILPIIISVRKNFNDFTMTTTSDHYSNHYQDFQKLSQCGCDMNTFNLLKERFQILGGCILFFSQHYYICFISQETFINNYFNIFPDYNRIVNVPIISGEMSIQMSMFIFITHVFLIKNVKL